MEIKTFYISFHLTDNLGVAFTVVKAK